MSNSLNALAILIGLAVLCRYFAHRMGEGGGKGKSGMHGGGGKEGVDWRGVFLWTAVVLFGMAGFVALGTFVEDIVAVVVGFHVAVGILAAAILGLGSLKDLANDKEPDGVAPFFVFFIPSTFANVDWTGFFNMFLNILKSMGN